MVEVLRSDELGHLARCHISCLRHEMLLYTKSLTLSRQAKIRFRAAVAKLKHTIGGDLKLIVL